MKQTSFGQQTICDSHVHFVSRSLVEQLGMMAGFADCAAKRVCDKLRWDIPPQQPCELGKRWVKELDRHGVDRSVLFHTLPGDVHHMATVVRHCPDRFFGFVTVNPENVGSLRDMCTVIDKSKFRGILLFPALLHFDLSASYVRDIFRFANERKLVVFVHCGYLQMSFRNKLGMESSFDLSRGDPLRLQPYAAEFPDVKIVIPHLGSGFLRELLMLADLCPNVYTDTSGMGSWTRHIPGRVTAEEALRQVLDVMGPHRVLFGTDSGCFPRGWRTEVFEQQLELFEKLKLGSDDVSRVLGRNFDEVMAVETPQCTSKT